MAMYETEDNVKSVGMADMSYTNNASYAKENNMNGAINTDGYVANAMYDNIRGFGYGYGGGFGAFAGPSANAVRINRNNDRIKDCCDTVQLSLDQAEESRRFDGLCERINNSELRNADRLRDIEREMAANARIAADCCCDTKLAIADLKAENQKCCCDTQKLILENKAETNLRFAELARQQCEDKAQIIAEVKAVESRNIERQLNATQAELTALKTQVACNCNCPS